MADHYNLLGVPRDADATAIRRAFRDRAKRVHPDANPGLDPQAREEQHRQFIRLAQAYDTLSDPQQRAAYDRKLAAASDAEIHARASRTAGRPGPRPRPTQGARTFRNQRSSAGSQGPGPTPGAAASDTDLEDLLGDVEKLLGQFGLDLKAPLERILDELLDWALAVYRRVTESLAGAGSENRAPGGRDETPRAGPASGSRSRPGPRAGPSADNPPRGPDEASVESELRRLKERARTPPRN